MSKPTYAELDKRIKELEQRLSQDKTDDNEKSKYSDMYSFLSDNVSDIIWMMDMNMNTIYVNSAAERKRGFTVEELLSQGLDEKLTPESKEIALKVFDEKLTEIKDGNIPEMVTLDLEFTCKDGSTFWGESNISFKFENGKPVAIYGITRDISEYREAKKDLEKKERLYRSAIKAAEGVSYYHDVLNKNYEFIDEGIKDLTGYSRDEFSPQIWDSIIVETVFWGGYRGMTYRGAKDHAEDYGERPYWKAEYKIRKKNGEEVWLADNSVLIYDAQGKTIASLGILQDITERKMAEEALESEHNLLKTLIENLPAAISVKDLNSEIIMCNQRAVENFRKNSMDDIIGKTDYDLIDKKIAEEFHKEEQEIIRTSIPIQNKIIHSSDKKKWGSNFKIPLRNSKGEITNLLAINYDVTELKLKEIENRDLERQLFHSQKMESIGRLAGGLAHDFNNILAGIMGYGELLKIHFDNPETMEGKAAEVIYEAAIKASKLTKQLLNFSRKEKHSTAPLNVNTVIINAVKISEKIFEEKVVVETRFCEELNMVEANESQLDQVFTNLLINANDAMPDGGKIILKTENICLDENNLRVLPELTRGNYVKIQVEDFGIGIPAGLKNKVFEPFFSTKIPEKGTGLGLATVYALIKNHKGQIIVESEEGKGTVFTIFLPVSDKRLVEAKKDPQLVKGIGTILMIDDDETILELVEKQFSFLGYKSILASNGKQGLEIYSSMKDEIDLVIIDIIMPEKDGFETFMRLKSINPRVKVIAASGYSKEDKAENLMKAGVLDFIQKPFKLADLSKRIDTILKT